jgi:hypothetical protein
MQKRVLFVVMIVIALALTVYGTHTFLSLKAGYHQTVGPDDYQVIQLGLPDKPLTSTQPAWTVTNQTAARQVPARNQSKVRIGSNSSVAECNVKNSGAQFFIAGVIVKEQPKDADERTLFHSNVKLPVAEASYIHQTGSSLAVN